MLSWTLVFLQYWVVSQLLAYAFPILAQLRRRETEVDPKLAMSILRQAKSPQNNCKTIKNLIWDNDTQQGCRQLSQSKMIFLLAQTQLYKGFVQFHGSEIQNKVEANLPTTDSAKLLRSQVFTALFNCAAPFQSARLFGPLNQIFTFMNSKVLSVLLLTVSVSCKLVFYDEFDSLDFRKWRHDLTLGGGGNHEFQMYINNRTVTYTKNSRLYIQPVPLDEKIGPNAVRNNSEYEIWGGTPGDFCTGPFNNGCKRTSNGDQYLNPIMSGKLTTAESFTFTYGRVQVRAKLPKGDWLWPAIWLMPRYFEYGDWPSSGEIDIMQSRGNVGYPRQSGGGPQTFGSTIHWGADWTTNQFWRTRAEYTINGTTLADDFHTYGLYWDEKQLYTYLDNDTNRVLVVDHGNMSYWQRSQLNGTGRANPWQYSANKCAPFDREFYLILNVAVGGTIGYFQDGVANKPWSDKSSRPSAEFYDNKGQWLPTWKKEDSAMQVDFVKVWDLSAAEERSHGPAPPQATPTPLQSTPTSPQANPTSTQTHSTPQQANPTPMDSSPANPSSEQSNLQAQPNSDHQQALQTA